MQPQPAPPPPAPSAMRIGSYRLQKTLGIGSFGKVKRECPVWLCVLRAGVSKDCVSANE